MSDLISVIQGCDSLLRTIPGSARILALQVLTEQYAKGGPVPETPPEAESDCPKVTSGAEKTGPAPSAHQISPADSLNIRRVLEGIRNLGARSDGLSRRTEKLSKRIEKLSQTQSDMSMRTDKMSRRLMHIAKSQTEVEQWAARIDGGQGEMAKSLSVLSDTLKKYTQPPLPPPPPSAPPEPPPPDCDSCPSPQPQTDLETTRRLAAAAAEGLTPSMVELLDLLEERPQEGMTPTEASMLTARPYGAVYANLTKLLQKKRCTKDHTPRGVTFYPTLSPTVKAPEPKEAPIPLQQRIMRLLKQSTKPVAVAELVKKTGAPYNSVTGRLTKLLETGRCRRVSQGMYESTSARGAAE